MKFYLLAVLLSTFLLAQAQRNKQINYTNAIGISPLAMIQLEDYTLMFNYEYRLKKKLALVSDVGFIFYSEYMSNASKTIGFTFRPSVRFYLDHRNSFYLQPQILYKMVVYTIHDWLDKETVNGVPAYQQLQDFKYGKYVVGGNLIIGGVLPIGRKVFFDLYAGLGLRHKTNRIIGEPKSSYTKTTGLFADLYTDGITVPSVPAGLKVIYLIN